jgi:3-hydroxybutyrate dehydrogenase
LVWHTLQENDMTTQTSPIGTSTAPLAGRVAIVTGSTSGIGLGIARSLAEAGADIVLNGLGDPEQIEATRAELAAAAGVRVTYNGANLLDGGDAGALVTDTIADFGKVDILVNNAGIQHVSPIENFPVDKWNAIQALNLSASFHTTRAAFGAMKAAGWGRIINLASVHGLIASPYKSAYVAAKHGVIGLTKTVALEGAQFGVTCNAVCPGYVWTPLVEGQIEGTAKARGISREDVINNVLLAAQPSKRFVTVEELGGVTVFLCSEAARSITGVALPVDGGWTGQ